MSNKNLILIAGASATGKSASLRNLENPEGVVYLGTESGKDLPFKSKFIKKDVVDPLQVEGVFGALEEKEDIHTIVIDSLTYLLDAYETMHVLTSSNTMQAWGNFQQFFKRLMLQHVASSSKNVIFTAHNFTEYNADSLEMETKINVKGALKNNGLESYYGTIVYTTRKTLKELEGYESDLLTITEEEEMLGFKYCFQTKLTKETVHSRIRSPMGMFTNKETFMDNDAQLLLNRVNEYYN